MRRSYFVLFVFLICKLSTSQVVVERQVIGSTGSLIISGNIEVSSTVGEVVIPTFSQSSLVVTQGFQQADNILATISIAADPNPFCPGAIVNFTTTTTNTVTTPFYQWKVNGSNVGSNSPTYSNFPQSGDSVRCIMSINLSTDISSNKIIMVALPTPSVSFAYCFDSITTSNAKPIKLKGGLPLGGTYSGPGVNPLTGVFTPSIAGVGIIPVTYSYTNINLCTAAKVKNIDVQSPSTFNCGNNFIDIRDNKVYPTVQIGSQCWMSANLNFGNLIPRIQPQDDNCAPEKYCFNDLVGNCQSGSSIYQWDELMQYDDIPGVKGLCPSGWHVPIEDEWETLFAEYITKGLAGSPLKYSGNSGFNALLNGVDYLNYQWYFHTFATLFWSSSSVGTYAAWAHGLNDSVQSVSLYSSSKANAFSVRCLKDNCNIIPNTPAPGSNMSSPTQIIWNWNSDAGATGYKWSTTNNYTTATDMGISTTKTETSLTCNTAYSRYVWAYSLCGYSAPVTLTQTTTLDTPAAPTAGTQVPSPTQIIWNWNTVIGATGYKWSTTNDFASAIDMGPATTITETTLTCNTTYTRYTWAYNLCGNSTPITLTQTTSLNAPATPTAGTHVPSQIQIIWNWNTVTEATGYKWNTSNDYTTATDMLTSTVKTESGLTCNTPYNRFVWAYNACGNSTPIILNQTTADCGGATCAGTIMYGSQLYNTVQIGTQCWFKENLNIGTWIYSPQEQSDNSTIEKYCYGDLESNCNIYGGLYQWNEMMQYITTAGAQGICPSGWHIPTDGDWCTVTQFLDPLVNCATQGYTGANAGGKMKTTGTVEAGTGLWFSPNTGATNESGFSAIPAGMLIGNSTFFNIGPNGNWWSSSEDNTFTAWYWAMYYLYSNVNRNWYNKSTGLSVRCLKDACSAAPTSPNSGTHIPSPTQIIWNWNTVPGATGYKWSTVNDYSSATDMGIATTKIETGLICNMAFTRYVWAYNLCGNSGAVILTQTTSLDPPLAPISGTQVPSPTQIIWNWNAVSDAPGYKWNTTNTYATAIDMGNLTTKTETGLTCNSAYTRYVWAYNGCGISNASALAQTTTTCFVCGQPITDSRNGKIYNTVLIGTQCWMKENMNIGTTINSAQQQTNNSSIEKYCYNELETNCDIYGGLYQWDELMNYTTSSNSNPSGRQGICPVGWHIPSENEWCQMETFIDQWVNCSNTGFTGVDAGERMKEAGTSHWATDPGVFANSSGFTALPGGYFYQGIFNQLSIGTNLWSSTESTPTFAWNCHLRDFSPQVNRGDNDKLHGESGRCLKDN